MWQESIKLIKQHPFLGNGLGNSTEALSEAFKLINYERGIVKGYNAQNQFLESFLEMGVIGFTLLLGFMGYSYCMAWMERNKLYLAYLSVITIYMVTESLWQTQMGMVSFAFFNAFIINSSTAFISLTFIIFLSIFIFSTNPLLLIVTTIASAPEVPKVQLCFFFILYNKK